MTMENRGSVLYHVSASMLEAGDVIQPGNWGRVLRGFGSKHNRWFKECLFEAVRQSEHADLASRFETGFAFETHDAANGYAATNGQLVYMVSVPGGPWPRFDMSWIDYADQFHTPDGVLNCARSYWSGEVRDIRLPEVPVTVPMTVIQRMTRIVENGRD